MAQLEYLTKIMQVIEKIDKEQSENIQAAADLCAATIHSGKLVHLFGSGHSVLPVQDVFPRYGGVVGWHPVMDPRLMWNNVIGPGGARELLWIERQEGYIANFLQSYNFQEGEVMIVFSHGGLNAAPIEAAMYAKERGYHQKVGASSTVAVITIAQSIASETALRLEKLGHKMYIFVSPNVTEVPKEYMHEVYADYRRLVFDNSNM